jgi:hypothetical protein
MHFRRNLPLICNMHFNTFCCNKKKIFFETLCNQNSYSQGLLLFLIIESKLHRAHESSLI